MKLEQSRVSPQSMDQVESVMNEMDKVNGTQFKGWIKNEDNIGYLCTFKRSLFEENWETQPASVFNVLYWLVDGWNIASVAEFMLKMFYHWKLDSVKFGVLVNGLTKGLYKTTGTAGLLGKPWEDEKIYDLLHVLLIGESPKACAKFIKNFTTGVDINVMMEIKTNEVITTRTWSREDVLDLVKNVSFYLHWDESFMRAFLMEYTTLMIPDDTIRQQSVLAEIQSRFLSPRPPVTCYTPIYFPNSFDVLDEYSSLKSEIAFSVSILDLVLLEAEEYELESILQDLKLNGVAAWKRMDQRINGIIKSTDSPLEKPGRRVDRKLDLEE